MKFDRYSKFILTVIAILLGCLVWLQLGQDIVPPAEASHHDVYLGPPTYTVDKSNNYIAAKCSEGRVECDHSSKRGLACWCYGPDPNYP